MHHVCVLGSTGSVGGSALEVLAELRETHRVSGLVARRSAETLIRQARALDPRPAWVGVVDEAALPAVRHESLLASILQAGLVQRARAAHASAAAMHRPVPVSWFTRATWAMMALVLAGCPSSDRW